MAKLIKINYRNDLKNKKIDSIDYELKCIKEPTNKKYGRDLIKVGESYICSEINANNWNNIYLVTVGACGVEVGKDCFEELPRFEELTEKNNH